MACSVASNSDLCDVSFYRQYNCAGCETGCNYISVAAQVAEKFQKQRWSVWWRHIQVLLYRNKNMVIAEPEVILPRLPTQIEEIAQTNIRTLLKTAYWMASTYIYLSLRDMENNDSSDYAVHRLSTEQHDHHITGWVVGVILLHALHNNFRSPTAIGTSGIRRYLVE